MGSIQGWLQSAVSMLGVLFVVWRWSIGNRKEMTELTERCGELRADNVELRRLMDLGDQERPTKAEYFALKETMAAGFEKIYRELAGFGGKGGLVAGVDDVDRELRRIEKEMHQLDKLQDKARHDLRDDISARFNLTEARLLKIEGVIVKENEA